MKYTQMTKPQIKNELESVLKQYESCKEKGLKLDMSRGKPGAKQLDLTNGLLTALSSREECFDQNGADCRNYGIPDGIPQAKALFAQLLQVGENEIIIGGNSSLNLMYDTMLRAMYFGVGFGMKPWSSHEKVKFLCPVPGYDRHFAICEELGIEMINIPTDDNGPDMDMVSRLVSADESIKGIWCVPKYSNPTGITYSDEVVRAFAALKPKAADFRIFWDNAYAVHDLYEKGDELLNLLSELKKSENPDMAYIFASSSKITYPGAGVAMIASSEANIKEIKKRMFFQTIGHDKINQMRHVLFFKNVQGIYDHMRLQAQILRPKFETVDKYLESELGGLGIARWNKPGGGYFVSLNLLDGCARKTVELAAKAGVVLTGAGATYPYTRDDSDSNIRIAPTYPPDEELETAMSVLCVCAKIACLEALEAKNQ